MCSPKKKKKNTKHKTQNHWDVKKVAHSLTRWTLASSFLAKNIILNFDTYLFCYCQFYIIYFGNNQFFFNVNSLIKNVSCNYKFKIS